MKIVTVPLTDKADSTSVENGTAVNFFVLNVNDYYSEDVLRLEQIKTHIFRYVILTYHMSLCAYHSACSVPILPTTNYL